MSPSLTILAIRVILMTGGQLRVIGVRAHIVVGVHFTEQLREEMFGPNDAMDGKGRRVAYSTRGVRTAVLFGSLALIALGDGFVDEEYLSHIALRARLYERHVCRQT